MKLDNYDFREHYVTVDGHRLHYVDEGDGQLLLMLHGNPTWAYLYRHLIAGLRQRHRCVVPDLLGFGLSDKPPWADYGMRAQVMRFDLFVKKLGLRDITLVLHDWGGVIGLAWAVRNKHKVKRLVLMNTTGFASADPLQYLKMSPRPWVLFVLLLLKIRPLGEIAVLGLNGFVRYYLPFSVHNRHRLNPEVMKGYIAPYPTLASRRAQLSSVRQIPLLPIEPVWTMLEELSAELDGWMVPTQIIWGMRDRVFVPWFMEQFEKYLPNHAATLRIEDASHFLQDDTPELITERIAQFTETFR